MDFEKNLKDDIIIAVRAELGLFRSELKEEFGDFKAEMRGEFGDFKTEMKGELKVGLDDVNAQLASLRGEMHEGLDRLELMMEDMDDKFTLVNEGQDIIREVLETRVGHIEELLGVQSGV